MDKKKLIAEDRLNLKVLLQYKTPINEIANKLGFHKSSIYREIEKYSIHKNVHSRNCNIKHIVCNGCHKKFNCTSYETYYDWEIANKKSLKNKKTSREKVNINEEELKLINDILIICKTFYTRPYRSTDKLSCENLHRLLRYAFPKGKSLDNLTQDVLDEVFSHINSYVRKSLIDKTPYDLIKKKFGKEFLVKINIKRIPKKG